MDEKPSNPEEKSGNPIVRWHRYRFLAAVFTISLLIRLLFALVYWVDKPITHDAQEYLLLADNITNGHGYCYTVEQLSEKEHHERAPVYPFFLAAIFFVFGKSMVIVKVFQVFISALLPLLIYAMGRKLLSEETGRLAALITMFYPPLLWGTGEFLSEILFTTVAMLGVFYLADYSKSLYLLKLFIGTFWLLAAAHIKPVILIILPFIALWIWLRRGLKNIAGFKHSIIFALLVLAFLIPWIARNYFVEDKFVLIASEGGITFWTGNNPLAVGDGDMAANPKIKKANNKLRKTYAHLTPAELERVYYRESFSFIRNEPGAFILLLFKKGFYFWFPVGRSMSLFSVRHQVISHISYFPILLLSILSIFPLIRARKLPVLFLVVIIGNMIACMIFFPQERYRIPLVDPFLVLLAAYYFDKVVFKYQLKS